MAIFWTESIFVIKWLNQVRRMAWYPNSRPEQCFNKRMLAQF